MAERQYVTFWLNDDYLGLDIRLVREVQQNPEITPVPLSSDYVAGLMNLRGQVVTVIDLSRRMGIEPAAGETGRCCIVLKTNDEVSRCPGLESVVGRTGDDQVAFLVSRVGDVVSAADSDTDTGPSRLDRVQGRFLDGVVTLDDSLLVVLRASTLLGNENQLGPGAASPAALPTSASPLQLGTGAQQG